MTYVQRGPWPPKSQFTSDDGNAFDDAIGLFNGHQIVDLGNVSGAVTVDCSLGGAIRANLTANAALTLTNAATTGQHRTTDLLLSTNGYVPTFPGSIVPVGGLSGDYIGAVEHFVTETAAGYATPLVRHVAGYGRYRSAFVGVNGGELWRSDDGVAWQYSTVTQSFLVGADRVAFSPTAKVFVWLGMTASSPSLTWGVNTSRDGLNWTRQTFTITAASVSSVRLRWNKRTSLFELQAAASAIYTSPDGVIWTSTARTGLPDTIDFDNSPTLYVGVNGGQNRYTSTNGSAWTASGIISPQTQHMLWIDAWNLFVTFADSDILTSPDGTTWTGKIHTPAPSAIRNGVLGGTRLAIASKQTNGFGDILYMSTNGSAWTQVALAVAMDGDEPYVMFNSRIGRWVVWYSTNAAIQSSADTATWTGVVSLSKPSGTGPDAMAAGD